MIFIGDTLHMTNEYDMLPGAMLFHALQQDAPFKAGTPVPGMDAPALNRAT